MPPPRRRGRIVRGLAVAVFLVPVGLASMALVVAWQAGWSLHRVQTGSMEPELGVDSLALVAPASPTTVSVGEVIVFRHPVYGSQRVMHRVVGVVEQDGQRFFRTRGDANESEDPWLVPGDRVESRLIFDTPRLGRALDVLRPPWSYLLLVGLPLALGLAGEVRKRRGRNRGHASDARAPTDSAPTAAAVDGLRTGVRAETLGRFVLGSAVVLGLSLGAHRARRL